MGTFGFIIHPIDVTDVYRKYPLAKHLPPKLVERALSYSPPIKVSHITGVKSPYGGAEGYFVSCPLTPRLMLGLPEPRVTGKIITACNKAAELGAKVVGLGAFTSVVGDAGITIRKNVDIAVTTGNSYTVATAIEAAEKAARLMEIDMDEANVLVLGATGSIGKVLSYIMADEGRHSNLCARTRANSRGLPTPSATARMLPESRLTCAPAVRQADVVMCVSSAIDALHRAQEPEARRAGLRLSRPRILVEVKKQRMTPHNRRRRGDRPGDVEFNFNFGFPEKTSYACMAETMILALEEKYVDWSLGRDLTIEGVTGIAKLAKKHGFKVAGFRSFERAVTAEEIERIKENSRRRTPRSA